MQSMRRGLLSKNSNSIALDLDRFGPYLVPATTMFFS